jgi:hypothetical protein
MLPPMREARPPNIFCSVKGFLATDQLSNASRKILVVGHGRDRTGREAGREAAYRRLDSPRSACSGAHITTAPSASGAAAVALARVAREPADRSAYSV